MTNKDNTILWVIGIAILLFLILPNIQKPQNEALGLNVHYYKDGKEVSPQRQFFSVVTPDGGTYDAIAFNVTARNTGAGPINNIVITSFTGGTINLLSYFPSKSFGNLSIGQSVILTSNPIPTLQFEALTQPVLFTIQVGGTNPYNNQPINQQGSASLTITPCVAPTWAYQESANVTSSCVTKNTGYYSLSPYYFYSTYKKPTAATSASLWQVKFGNRATENITIPSSCWSYSASEIKFRFYSNGADSIGNPSVYGQCYDGTWKTITAVGTFPGGTKNSPGAGGNKYLYDGNWNTGSYVYYGNQLFYQNLYGWDYYSTVYEEAMNWRF